MQTITDMATITNTITIHKMAITKPCSATSIPKITHVLMSVMTRHPSHLHAQPTPTRTAPPTSVAPPAAHYVTGIVS